jgi:hypothetical protein
MNFKDFITSGKVVISESDKEKSKSLKKMSISNLQALKKIVINEENSSIILSQSYESLRQILEAMTLIEGYKVYSHEAYTYYLEEKNEITYANRFDRLRKLRNGVNYYGKPVSKETALISLKEIEEMIDYLNKKYLQV